MKCMLGIPADADVLATVARFPLLLLVSQPLLVSLLPSRCYSDPAVAGVSAVTSANAIAGFPADATSDPAVAGFPAVAIVSLLLLASQPLLVALQ
jgi:hypothetical protein